MTLSLAPVKSALDLRAEYRHSPIEDLFRYHEQRAPARSYAGAPLLVVTCMDWRIDLRFPSSFAYVLRTAGANVESVLFNIDYAVTVAGVRAIALIGHDDCAMASVRGTRSTFLRGLVAEQGWSEEKASRAFESGVSGFGIDGAIASVWSSARALRMRYPNRLVAPLHYLVQDGRLLQIVES